MDPVVREDLHAQLRLRRRDPGDGANAGDDQDHSPSCPHAGSRVQGSLKIERLNPRRVLVDVIGGIRP